MNYKQKNRLPRRLLLVFVVVVVLILGGILLARHTYNQDLKAVSSDQKTQIITIKPGTSTKEIAAQLADAHLIRSAWAFDLYVHSKSLGAKLQAGTYALAPNQSTPSIIATITKGQVSTALVTILPGRRIDQVRADLINSGFTPSDVDKSLDPAQYANLPVLAYKPTDVNTLEGLLWPDSWYKDASSSASDIIRQSLIAMGERLTPDVQAQFAAENLTIYQGITLTSIIMKEVSKPADQAQAAQVFLSRLKAGSDLGSDVTAIYGAIAAGKTSLSQGAMLAYDSPYNTLMHAGLPPTPISSINATSLQAATHPAATNWLYFVSGDDGNTYFSTTLEQHNQQTQQYCHKLCGQ